jgi:hypothetical protein
VKLSAPSALKPRLLAQLATVERHIGAAPRGLSVTVKLAKGKVQAKSGEWGLPKGTGVVTGKASGTPGRLSYTVTLYTAPGDKAGGSVHDHTIRHELAHCILLVGRIPGGEQHQRIEAMEKALRRKR